MVWLGFFLGFYLGFYLGGALVMSFLLKVTSMFDDTPGPRSLYILCVICWPSTLYLIVKDEEDP